MKTNTIAAAPAARFSVLRKVTCGYFRRKHCQKAGKLVYVNNIISFCTTGNFYRFPLNGKL